MQKYWGTILVMLCFIACGKNKNIANNDTTKIPEPPKIITHYGFNLDNFKVIQDTIRKGDSFGKLMLQNHADYPKVIAASENFKDTFDVRKIKIGKPYLILKTKDTLEKAEVFIYENDKINYTVVDMRDSVLAYKQQKKISLKEKEVGGTITNSLSVDMDSLGVDYNVTLNLSEIYAWTIDFFHLQKGDKFKIVYDERYINDSIYAGPGKIKAAFFEHKGKPIYAFPYVTDSIQEYYDQDANNLRSTFLRAPIKFGYRLSSRYNLKRRIAYYGYKVRPHRGTDYAAPVGTPIVATADGTVTESRRRGGNGKYVKIRHNSMYSTQYLHMKAQKVKEGEFVRQGDVIGWVGMTGNTGGPHVCYRFWKNGVQVDPLKEKLPSADPIVDSLRTPYFEHIAPIKRQLDCIKFTVPETKEKENPLTIDQEDGLTQN